MQKEKNWKNTRKELIESFENKMNFHWKKLLRVQGGLEFLKSNYFKKKEKNNG